MKRLIVLLGLILVCGSAYTSPLFLRVYGTITPYSVSQPISILDDFGFSRIQLEPGLSGSAGLELEWVLPIESDLGISLLLGGKYIFPKRYGGAEYSYIPVFLGSKVSVRILPDYPWSLYLIARAGYNVFLPDAQYNERVFSFRGLEQVGGFYVNGGIGSEVLLWGPISLLLEVGYEGSWVSTSPAFIILGETKEVYEGRLDILIGVSIDL